jgi:hypothetical protein
VNDTSRTEQTRTVRPAGASTGVRPIGQFCTLQRADTEGTEADQNGGSARASLELDESQ